MAGRVNTRFVIILVVVVLTLVVAIAGLRWYTSRRNPSRYMAQASELLNNNELEKAVSAMSRAYSYEKDTAKRVAILTQMADTIQRISAPTTARARELLTQMENCWSTIVELEPGNTKASQQLLDLSYRRAEMFPQFIQLWNKLYDDSQNMLKYSPDSLVARRYRGLAQVVRLGSLNLGEQAAKDAADDLHAVLKADPNDARAAVALATLDMNASEEATRINNTAKARQLQKQAADQIDQFIASHPDNPQALLGRFQMLMRIGIRNKDQKAVDNAMKVLDQLEALLLKADHPNETRQLADRLITLDGKTIKLENGQEVRSGLYRAEQLLRHIANQHHDDVAALAALGMVLEQEQRWQDALAFFQLARRDRAIPVSIDALRINDYRQQAAKEIVDVHLILHELAKDPDERKKELDTAQTEMKELVAIAGDGSPVVQMMRGKLALVNGNSREAISKLEKVNVQLESRNPEVLGLLASAYLAADQTGAAATTLEKLMATPGGALQIKPYLDLARLRLRSGDVSGATDLLDRVLKFQPENIDALLLKSQAIIQAGTDPTPAQRRAAAEQAIAALKPVASRDDRRVVVQLSTLNERAGHSDKAVSLLDGYLKNHSDDLAVLQQLVRLEVQLGRKADAQKRVDAAIAADPNNKMLGLLQASLKGDADIGKRVEDLIQQQDDPLSKQLALWQFYQRSNKDKEAAEALAEAAKIAPNDERVLGIQFDQALASKEWSAASKVIDQIKKLNDGAGLDYAGGAFWQARLELAQDHAQRAATILERGLKDMPSDSQAWLLLGVAQLSTGDTSGAERSLRKSIDLKPENTVAWRQLYRLHDQQGEYDQALDDLRKAVTYSGGNNDLAMEYISYLGRHGDVQQAIAMRQQIAKAQPDNDDNQRALAELYLQTNQPDKCKAILDQLQTAHPDKLENIYAMAVYDARTDHFDQGLELIRNYVHGLGEKATAEDWAVFARFLRGGNQAEQAASAFKQAIAKDTADGQPIRREYADWLFAMQKFADAADQYAQVLAATTNQTPGGKLLVWRRYIETLMKAGKLDQSETELAKLIKEYPSDPQAQLLKGLQCEQRLAAPSLANARKQQLTEEADLAYDRAVTLAPDSSMAYTQRARFRFDRDGETVQTQVRDDLNKAIELDGNNILARQLLAGWNLKRGDSNAAIAELNRLLQVAPNSIPARAQLAELYLNNSGNMSELSRLLDDSIQRMPTVPAWHQYRARMYQMQQQWDAAEQELAKAYELDKSVGRMAEYANLLLRRNKDQKVLDLMRDWPQQMAGSALLQAMRGQALYRLNHPDEAVAAFNIALDLAGQDPRQYNMVLPPMAAVMGGQKLLDMLEPRIKQDGTGEVALAAARVRLELGQTAAAITQLEGLAGKFKPEDAQEVDRQRMLARAYYEVKQFNKSRDAYTFVLQKAPQDLMSLNNLAFMLADDMHDPQSALPLAEQAVGLSENIPAQRANVLDTLGWVQFRNNDLRAAEDSLRRSVNLNSLPVNNLHLAQVYIAQNRTNEARQTLMQAKTLAEAQKDQATLQQVQDLLKSIAKPAVSAER